MNIQNWMQTKNKKCLYCLSEFLYYKKNDKFCSKNCQQKAHREKFVIQNNKKYQNLKEGKDYISCVICNFKARQLASHLSKHNLTPTKYKEKYNAPTICETLSNKYSEQLKGENNPAFNRHLRFQ